MFVGLSKSTSRPLPPSKNRASSSLGGGTLSTENSTAISTLETARPSKNLSAELTSCVSVAVLPSRTSGSAREALTATYFRSQLSGVNTSRFV